MRHGDTLRRWRVAGIVATLVIVLSVSLHVALRTARRPGAPPPEAQYVGSEKCRACHDEAFEKWKGSHHALAMQAARDGTVLGDFGDAAFEHRGKRWRFYRRGEKFLVSAEGPDGQLREYEIAYTFGVEPLQQYLVPFPGGRLQALSAAWDTRAKRWFSVYPGRDDIPPGDWLHWTRPGQNWNTMCADCHSTAVRKRYDPGTDSFQTTWSEIAVGCEGCHGPGSLHVAWAQQPAMGRPPVENVALVTRTAGLSNRELVNLCAPCHARRAQFVDQGIPGGELLDRYLPVTLSPGTFHADGQIREEDFEYHAFLQSRMYASGVGCSDCHDVHSGKLHEQGNALCNRCHRADTYDAPAHHFHKREWNGKPSAGALCVSCHMPGQNFMVVHFRRDHSMRVPRPDVSQAVASPDACSASGCHSDKQARWISARYDAWWGKTHEPHYGTILAAGRTGDPAAEADLVRLSQDQLLPEISRATALELLGAYGSEASVAALEKALADPDPMIRRTAASRVRPADPARFVRILSPLLEDPVRAVRAEAAARLAEVPSSLVGESQRESWRVALREYVEAQLYTSDMPSGPFNLGNLYANQGRTSDAEAQYRRAIALDGKAYMAKANLALLIARVGRLDEAEQLLREAQATQPRDATIAFNLGLLLAERGKRGDAEEALRAALAADPGMAPAAYNLAVMVGDRSPRKAVELARKAASRAPGETRYGWTLAFFQSRAGDLDGAVATLERLLWTDPAYGDAYLLLGEVYERQQRSADAASLYARAQGVAALPQELRAELARRGRALEAGRKVRGEGP
jgi:tetratricopeptide (TPR) repeat protein